MSSSAITFEALLDSQVASMVALTSDGRDAAYVVWTASHPKAEPLARRLWTVALDGGDPAPVQAPGVHAFPAWSHDGARLAFVSDDGHPGRMSPWVRDAADDARPVGEVAGTVEALLWSADGAKLLVLAADMGSDGAGMSNWTRIVDPADARDPVVTRPDTLWRRLLLVDVESGETTECGPEGLNVWEVGWNGAGEAAAVVSRGTSEGAYYDASVALLDLDARTHRIVHEAEWQLASPTVAPDGGQVAFVEGMCSDRAPSATGEVTVVDVATGTSRVLAPELHVQRLRWLPDGTLFYLGQAGVETMCGRLTPEGTTVSHWQGPATLGQIQRHNAAASDDGRVVVAPKEAPGEPAEIMALETDAPDRGWRRLTNLNGPLRDLATPHVERVSWQSDGVEIEGILVTPRERGEERLPLVVIAHGGPVSAWTMNYSAGYLHHGLPLAERGYAVLLPNPRGSSGRGQAFVRSLLGQFGALDLDDILAGVASLHEVGVVDRERVGITGISGGGYLSAHAATRSTAFKVSIPISCVSHWVSFHLTSNIGRFDEIFLQSDAYEPGGNHCALSPVMHVREAVTPTLILHGALDLCTPLGQAQELYRALVDVGIDTELVVYEHAGHVPVQREYLVDAWERVTSWFDWHLR